MTRTTSTAAPVAVAFALLCCTPLVHSWKQLTPPTSFSISQQHPAAGGQHHHTLNALGDDGQQHQLHGGAGGAHSSSSITFGSGSAGPTISTHVGHEPAYTISSGSSSEEEQESQERGQSEPRILHHGSDAVFESNYYGDLGAPSVSTGQRTGFLMHASEMAERARLRAESRKTQLFQGGKTLRC